MGIPGDRRAEAPRRWILWTKIIIVASLALLLGWDVVVANNPWRADTVSEITLWASLRSLTLVGALGYVAGHLTWPAQSKRPKWFVFTASGILLAVLLTVDVLTWAGVVEGRVMGFVRTWPPLVFLPSYILGRVFWPQVRS